MKTHFSQIMLKDLHAYNAFKKHPTILTQKMEIKATARAEEYLTDYEKGTLKAATEDYKILAEYIAAFAGTKRNKLLDKLQKSASFDVREYLTSARIISCVKLKSYAQYLDAPKLRQAIASHNLLKHKQKSGKLRRDEERKLQAIFAFSHRYIKDFLSGKFALYANDVPLFKKYTSLLQPQLLHQVLTKIASKNSAVRERETPKSLTEKFIEKILLKISACKNKCR